MTRRQSPTQKAIDNLIYRVTTRTKRKPEPNPSDIKSFPYTAHLTQVKWDRMRARKRHDSVLQRD